MGYSVVDIAGIEAAGPGGAVRFVRRELGVEAFGINWFEVAANMSGPEHDETETSRRKSTSSSAARASTGRRRGRAVTAPVAFRFDPETVRRVTAGPDGLTMVAVGARRGSYEPRGPF